MIIVFNDYLFDNGWAEPYVVHIKLKTMHTASSIATSLRRIGVQLYNDVGLECSEDGINQIMEKFKELYPEMEVEWFVFSCPCVPFGNDVEFFDYED